MVAALSARRRNLLRIAWCATLLLVLVGSLLPADALPVRALSRFPDKLLHFAAYALLAFLPTLHEDRKTTLALLLLAVALGVAIEFAQPRVAGRFFELADMAADLSGVLAGFVLALPFRL